MNIGISLVVSLLLTAILLKLVASVLPGFEIDGAEPALIAALIASAVVVAVPLISLQVFGSDLPKGAWAAYAVGQVLFTVALALGITFAPGIKAGLRITLLAAIIVSVAVFGVSHALGSLLGGAFLM